MACSPSTDGTAAAGPSGARLVAIAAPHVSPEGGEAYWAAYGSLGPDDANAPSSWAPRTTGSPRPSASPQTVHPLGQAETDSSWCISPTEAGGRVLQRLLPLVEHSIEFRGGLPAAPLRRTFVSCPSSSVPSLAPPQGAGPKTTLPPAASFDVLAELAKREGERLLFVLHRPRPQDAATATLTAHADQGAMVEVGQRDRERLVRVLRRRGRPTLSGNRRPRSAALTLHLPADVPRRHWGSCPLPAVEHRRRQRRQLAGLALRQAAGS